MQAHRFGWLAALVIVPMLGCSAAPDPTGKREKDNVGDDAIQSVTDASAFPEAVEIDVIVSDPTNPSLCTGTLIRSNVVLTAKHCFRNGSTATLVHRGGGADPAAMVQADLHPDLDLAVLRIDPPVLLDPASLATLATQEAATNEGVDLVGRMDLFSDDEGTKLFTVPNVVDGVRTFSGESGLNGEAYHTPTMTTKGDSGGAMFRRVSDGPHQIYGVLFGADPIAFDGDAYTRVDAPDVASWINAEADAFAAKASGSGSSFADGSTSGTDTTSSGGDTSATGSSDCGTVTFVGECNGDLLSFCDGTLQTVDCSQSGATCGFSDQEGLFDCL
jgi:hypothetical protein